MHKGWIQVGIYPEQLWPKNNKPPCLPFMKSHDSYIKQAYNSPCTVLHPCIFLLFLLFLILLLMRKIRPTTVRCLRKYILSQLFKTALCYRGNIIYSSNYYTVGGTLSYIVYIPLWMKGACWNMLEHSKIQFSFSKMLYIIKINARSWLKAEDDRAGIGEWGLEAWNHRNRFKAVSQLLSQCLHLSIKVYWKNMTFNYAFVEFCKCYQKDMQKEIWKETCLSQKLSGICCFRYSPNTFTTKWNVATVLMWPNLLPWGLQPPTFLLITCPLIGTLTKEKSWRCNKSHSPAL